jgi:nitroimidazol reductase NimA-like FMN-containing flavoprotein (pyridoxamine 5'-phosphate oxidase superfamily)
LVTVDAAGLRVLPTEECLALLRSVKVGRIALSHHALPMILPVLFRLDDHNRIVVEATRGTTLHHGTDGTVVAFEADGPSGAAEPTWSVVVHGVALHPEPRSRVADPADVEVAITIDQVTGREVVGSSGPLTLPRGRW